MLLQERENQLSALHEALSQVGKGNGRCVAILGEAGIGKSSLLRAFLAGLGPEIRVLRGSCEDMEIAEPLGPVRDLAREAGWQIDEALSAPNGRIAAFSLILSSIEALGRSTVIVIEDLHWADDATVDFLRFLTRRLDGRRILILATARGEDARGRANIRQLASGAQPETLVRLDLKPLSLNAVQVLAAGTGLDPQTIWSVTGGNAFYIAEVTKFGLASIPLSVEDAVLARLDGATPKARNLAETVSIFPRRAEVDLLKRLLDEDIDEALDTCLRSGLLKAEDDHVSFPHEIARLTVEQALPLPRRKKLHLACLHLLGLAGQGQAARRLHHARQAGDEATIRSLAPEAAEEAMQMGAPRSAADYYELALQHWIPGDPIAEVKLVEKTAWAHFLVGNIPRPVELGHRALAIYQKIGDQVGEGDSYRRLAQFHWMAARVREAFDLAETAVKTLRQHRGPELAMALTTQAQLAMLDKRYSQTIGPATLAVDLAREFQRPDIESHALNNLSQATWTEDLPESRRLIEESIDIAEKTGDTFNVARGYTNATFLELEVLDFAAAEALAHKGIRYAAEHELDGYYSYLSGALAWSLLRQGRWDEASKFADVGFDCAAPEDEKVLSLASGRTFSGACAQVWLSARRGGQIPASALSYIDDFMRGADEMQRLNVDAAMKAELTWLGLFDRDVALEMLRKVVARAENLTVVVESAIWLHRFDPSTDLSSLPDVMLPYRLEATGDIAGAAKEWETRAAPFDQAMALAWGDTEQRLQAIQIFQRLGAAALVQKVADDLCDQGFSAVLPKPRLSTMLNPFGLTKRQMDILSALSQGLSNQDIGKRLFISPKTVDHHVSAVLAKLEVSTRGEAAAKARKLSLI